MWQKPWSAQTAPLLQLQPQPLPSGPDTSVSPKDHVPSSSKRIRVKCIHCGIELNKKNLRLHIQRKHTDVKQTITNERHFLSQCIDSENDIFAVQKSFFGPSLPIHVQKRAWGANHRIMCEVDQCNTNTDFAFRSGLKAFECNHIKSLAFCPRSTDDTNTLNEEELMEMVQQKWFGEDRKKKCIERQKAASIIGVPLSVEVTIAGPSSKKYISVYEPKTSYYSRLGRVIVVFDSKKITWSCPCNKTKQSCVHKSIAKWHLFQTQKSLFRKVRATERTDPVPSCQHQTEDIQDQQYPPNDASLKKMVFYLLKEKRLPADLPKELINGLQPRCEFPRSLIPQETFCSQCKGNQMLSEPILITSRAKILTFTGVVEGISTYYKVCINCRMMFRYQEFTDGIHNFNDHLLISLHLCMILRNAIQNHTAVSRILSLLEATENAKFPSHDTVLHAYIHFEALTNHDYMYSCINCGYYPKVVIMDLHKKGVFSVTSNEIKSPPDDFKGDTNSVSFWELVTQEMVGRGFLQSGRKNPFVVPPSYDCWAPWIGVNTRKSEMVLNTEFAKIQKTKPCDMLDLHITEERLGDELFKMKVEAIWKLCKECGLESKGSKMDLVLRLRDEMQNRSSYDKVFQQIWGASGGWAVITCPCGVVYSIKFNIRAESPRDFADLLLSWKHLPNVSIYDFARGLATHTNLRDPETLPFSPHEGRLAEPSAENIQLAKDSKFTVNLPWLKVKQVEKDPTCHPLTGSSEHYVLYDRFHECNTKDPKDVLRRVDLVPQLSGWLNTQTAEQLFACMRKNNYFMNMLTPSANVFLMRNIIHLYNKSQNESVKENLRKIVSPNDQLTLNDNGQVIVGTPPEPVQIDEKPSGDKTQRDDQCTPPEPVQIDEKPSGDKTQKDDQSKLCLDGDETIKGVFGFCWKHSPHKEGFPCFRIPSLC
ncbi:uncharacterized protein LOC143730820 [Siphateles boraxobius]|uniref:uncharacterized protein LOC143730820 n=1 Tax=Siphateles boraxobius TaxID=180520 RepID=UPI0040644F4A